MIRWTGKSLTSAMVCETSADVDMAVMSIEHDPSIEQKESGNYLKPRIRLAGLDIEIENPRGSTRYGHAPSGAITWSCVMPDHYGYVRRTEGADGDEVDITIGPDHASELVFVIDQIDPRTGKFDEHKCFIWFANKYRALGSYYGSFSDGSGPARRGGVTTMTLGQFRSWIDSGETIARLTKKARVL